MAVGTVVYRKPSGYLSNPQSVTQQIITQETKTLKGICPEIDEILKDTFGCIIYQEQVMSIVHRVFHMTMGEADMFRRAIGKKDPELMKKMIEKLKKMDSGLTADQVEHIVETIEKCSGYIFNRSHSSAYAKTAYQTAYLKTYFPREFYCALLNSNIKSDKMVEYISEARNANIEVLPPSYPESDKKWTIDNGRLRFGLEKIKNVGNCNIYYNNEEITDIEHGGLLKAFCDLNPTINKQVPIAMAKAGCFQCSPLWCIEYIEWFKNYYTRVMQIRERLEKYKDNPKKVIEWEQKMNELIPPPEYYETSLEEEIAMQNEVLGMAFKSILDIYDMTLADRFFNIVGGVVKDIKKKIIKNGKPMYLIDLDENGITRGYTLFSENTNKIAIGDVVLVKKNKPNPYAKSHFDRTVISDILKATKK